MADKVFYDILPKGKQCAVCSGCGKLFPAVSLSRDKEPWHEVWDDICGPIIPAETSTAGKVQPRLH